MAEDEKVYTPETITEEPFPQEGDEYYDVDQNTSDETYSAKKINDQPVPRKLIAEETIGQALNTKSRKILGEFEFIQHGAIKVGKFEQGVRGEIKISPTGILGRDLSGLTTFSIDAENGDAIFKGELRAGTSIVANTILTEEASNGNGRTVYYNDGKPSILIGDPS